MYNINIVDVSSNICRYNNQRCSSINTEETTMNGMMDGWSGDEMYCDGNCGVCDECENNHQQQWESAYDAWREEQEHDRSLDQYE